VSTSIVGAVLDEMKKIMLVRIQTKGDIMDRPVGLKDYFQFVRDTIMGMLTCGDMEREKNCIKRL
jgi:hypothetical protein